MCVMCISPMRFGFDYGSIDLIVPYIVVWVRFSLFICAALFLYSSFIPVKAELLSTLATSTKWEKEAAKETENNNESRNVIDKIFCIRNCVYCWLHFTCSCFIRCVGIIEQWFSFLYSLVSLFFVPHSLAHSLSLSPPELLSCACQSFVIHIGKAWMHILYVHYAAISLVWIA